jgi:myo-inositol-1(or 4)-monophosphatase
MHPFLNVAVKAARRAGQIINRAALEIENLQVTRKGQSDYVTQVDRAAEDAIKEILLEAYPSHSILAEESCSTGAANAEFQSIIDPLDGTTNFIHGFPQYTFTNIISWNFYICCCCLRFCFSNNITCNYSSFFWGYDGLWCF